MKHLINPLVDCVFKAIFGDPAHAEVLLDFLNAITAPEIPIVDIEIVNPYSPQAFISDDLRVVDVRARNKAGHEYAIEIQLQVRPWMPSRVIYTWAKLYQGQLDRGERFSKLRPLTSIWVLAENLFHEDDAWHHVFRVHDPDRSTTLSDHLCIHTVELRKWRPSSPPLAAEDRWVYFLSKGHLWSVLPDALRTPELEKAMSVLTMFSEKEADYDRYRTRMDYLREQACIAEEREELEKALAKEQSEREQVEQTLAKEKAERAQAVSERDRKIEALQEALAAAGIPAPTP